MRNHLLLIPAALLIIAIAPLPYGYYTFLRLVVTVGAALVVWQEYNGSGRFGLWCILFAAIALLFNPLAPVHLDRGIWFFLDIGAAALFGLRWFTDKRVVV